MEFAWQFAILFDLEVFAVQPIFVIKNYALELYSIIIGSFFKILSMVEVISIHSH